jgi:hypothetical protein
MKRILVTDATCAIHKLLIQQLVAANYSVRIIASELNAGSPLLQLPVEIFSGNLYDEKTLILAARGCDFIINTSLPAYNKSIDAECDNKITFLMETFLKTAVVKVLHLQTLDIGKNLFSVVPAGNNNPGLQAIRPVSGSMNKIQQVLFSRKYALLNNVLMLSPVQQCSPLNYPGSINKSCNEVSMTAWLLEEENLQEKLYLLSEVPGKGLEKKQHFPASLKWSDVVRNVGLLMKVEIWKTLVYAYF